MAKIAIRHKLAKQILTPTSGYLKGGYSHSLNPYAGCVFGCSYCYVRKLPVALFRKEEWGTWVDVKEEAGRLLKKELEKAKKKGPVSIFMSSSTDPYQPVEAEAQVTRSLLEAMTEVKPDFLLVQTRSPLVARDIDLFLRLKDRIRISMTVETDLEEIRRAFSPSAPPVAARLKALAELKAAGLPVQVAVSPMLPSSEEFPRILAGVADRVCLDDFFMGDGSQGRRTEQLGIRRIFQQLGLESWYDRKAYLSLLDRLKTVFSDEQIRIGQEGFLPHPFSPGRQTS